MGTGSLEDSAGVAQYWGDGGPCQEMGQKRRTLGKRKSKDREAGPGGPVATEVTQHGDRTPSEREGAKVPWVEERQGNEKLPRETPSRRVDEPGQTEGGQRR